MAAIRLKISVSGIRGVVGETLSPRLLCRFAQAFGSYVGPGRVLVGRDTRPSGPMVAHAVLGGLMSTGCEPIDAGICPIPALQYRCAMRRDVCGAIAITASHNPVEWNALKLLSADGLFLSHSEANELLDIYHEQNFARVTGEAVPQPGYDEGSIDAHLEAVLEEVDVELIRRAKLRVAVDCVNGAGAEVTPKLLSRLGCKVIRLACQPSGLFPRPPEPLPENLDALCERARDGDVDVGFAQDADADRLAVVDENGRALDGDVMLAILVELVLRREPGPVVVNLSTSHLIDHIAGRYGVPVIRTPVGEANVVEAIEATRAVVGGEGSGGLIYPRIHACRDSFIGMALLLEHLARRGRTVAQLADALPARVMSKERLPIPPALARKVLRELRRQLTDGQLDLRDGIKASFREGWVHIRMSNTEPVMRVIVEAASSVEADALRLRVVDIVRQCTGQANPAG